MGPSGTLYTVTKTVTASNAVAATAATGLDTAVQNALTNLYGALPAGFQAGSIGYCCPSFVFDVTAGAYVFSLQIKYNIITP